MGRTESCSVLCGRLSWKQRIQITIGVVMPIVSMILAIIATTGFQNLVADFQEQVDSWKLAPVTDMQFVATLPCPSGYSQPEQLAFHYPVTECDCTRRNASDPDCSGVAATRTYGSCSGTRSRCQGCNTDTNDRSTALPRWPGNLPFLCVARAPETENALNRKRATTQGSCSAYSGTRLCGNWDCVPTTVTNCPVTSFRYLAPSQASAYSESTSSSSNSTALTPVLAFNRSDLSVNPLGALPLVRVRIGQQAPYSGAPTSAFAIPDGRWLNSRSLAAVDLIDVINANDPGLITSLTNMQVSPTLWTGESWVIAGRTETEWTSTCPTNRDRTLNVLAPKVQTVQTVQTISMVITIVVCIYNFFAAWQTFIELSDGDPSNDGQTAKVKAICNMTGEIINLVPTIIALVVAFGCYVEFQRVSDAKCSDSTTNDTIIPIAKELSKLGTINIVKTILATSYLIFRIVSLLRATYCPKRGAEPSATMKSDVAMAPPYEGPPPT